MNHDWIQTTAMALILMAATLFSLRHFLPEVYANGLRVFTRKHNRAIDINLITSTTDSSCQTKCSACNGCSMANKT